MLIKLNKYIDVPLVKFIIPFLIGVSLGIYFADKTFVWIGMFLFFVYVVYYLFTIKSNNISRIDFFKKGLNVFTLSAIFITAYLLSSFNNQENYNSHYSNFINKKGNSFIQIKLIKQPIEKDKSFKLIAEVETIKTSNTFINSSGKLIVYIEKSDELHNLNLGDKLFINCKIKELASPKNPNEFDYKSYLKYQNIFYQTYIKTTYWKKTSDSNLFSIINKINHFKNKLQSLILKYIYGKDEQAVMSALLLGNRNLLDKEILEAFSSSGATHILAVSGLHVGIFFTLLSFLLKKLKRHKTLGFLYPTIIIGSIWFYVLLTGASPSVMRAAIMYTLLAISMSLNKHFSVYNTIAASAIILILINPYIVTEVGFQLSYLAVIGIIYLQPRFYKMFVFKNKIKDWVWAISTVSLAAQISTLPLILLYFHQFPNLFFISNLFVIPAAAIILYGGMALFVFSFNETMATIIGHVLSYIIMSLNYALDFIKNLSFALSTGLYISYIQALLIYILIIWLSVAIIKRSKILLKYSLIIVLIITISFSFKYVKTKNQKIFTVYFVPKHSAFEFIKNNNSYSFIDSVLKENNNQMLFRIKYNWWEKRITNKENIEFKIYNENKVVSFENKTFLFIDRDYSIPKQKISVDYILVSNSPKLYLKTFSKSITSSKYIFDSSNKNFIENKWKKDCENLNLDCYFVNDNGAYVEEL